MIDYRAAFHQFVERERATGGPDHHRTLAAKAAGEVLREPARALWRVLCYVATYEICTGAQLWTHWPDPGEVTTRATDLQAWIEEHWPKLLWRRERRAVRSKPKLLRSLLASARFANEQAHLIASGGYTYSDLWTIGERDLLGLGRYALLKVFETFRRAGAQVPACPDIRPAGAWSPREGLALLFPEHATLCNEGGDRPRTLEAVQELAQRVRALEFTAWDSWETIEILLCNFRVAVSSSKEYPGRRLDTDLGNWHASTDRWHVPPPLPFFEWRRQAFPASCLGELGGWQGRRDELGACFPEHGYFWCDTVFDYQASRNRLADPVTR